jgi:hypothetical protein
MFLGPTASLIPIYSTIIFAVYVHCTKSFEAEVVTLLGPFIIYSAILPPSPTHILFSRYSFEYIPDSIVSSLGENIVTPPDYPLGTIDILLTTSYSFIIAPINA